MRALTRKEAPRVAVRASGLAGGVSSVLDVVERPGDLQLGDELVGRIDTFFERATGRLVVNAVHPERGRTLRLDEPLERLAAFLGASEIVLPR